MGHILHTHTHTHEAKLVVRINVLCWAPMQLRYYYNGSVGLHRKEQLATAWNEYDVGLYTV